MPAQKFYPLISIVLDGRKQIFWLSSEMAISNIGMRSMQELFFSAVWVEMGQFEYLMLPFLLPKRAYLSKNEDIAERQKKPNLSELTQIL